MTSIRVVSLSTSLAISLIVFSYAPTAQAIQFSFGSDCKKGHQKDIKKATSLAKQRVSQALENLEDMQRDLKKDPTGNTEYNDWFGKSSSTDYREALFSLHKVKKSLDSNTSYRAVCVDRAPECEPSDNACSEYGVTEIGFCGDWFNNGRRGNDSKPGAVIHDLTHILLDTEDYAYGIVEVMDLAEEDPDKAVRNADSYEYFVEQYYP